MSEAAKHGSGQNSEIGMRPPVSSSNRAHAPAGSRNKGLRLADLNKLWLRSEEVYLQTSVLFTLTSVLSHLTSAPCFL